MFCFHCGHTLPPGAAFCPNCGKKVETPSNAPAANASGQTRHIVDSGTLDGIKTCMNRALIITILSTFGCGAPFNIVLGIAAIVNAYNAEGNLKSGNFEKSEQCAKTAKTLNLLALAVIGLQLIFVFFLYVVMAGAALLSR